MLMTTVQLKARQPEKFDSRAAASLAVPAILKPRCACIWIGATQIGTTKRLCELRYKPQEELQCLIGCLRNVEYQVLLAQDALQPGTDQMLHTVPSTCCHLDWHQQHCLLGLGLGYCCTPAAASSLAPLFFHPGVAHLG